MLRTTLYVEPPRWLEAAVSFLLPPSCRETVLGDLQERFAEHAPSTRWLAYVADAVTTVPQVVQSRTRRTFNRGSLCAISASGDLRSRAEQHQTQVWVRNAILLVSMVFMIGIFLLNSGGDWHFHESVTLAMTIGWIGATWRSYVVRGRSTSVPASLSLRELRAFHRREILRQMKVGYREFIYWSTPAALLTLYALVAEVPDSRRWMLLLCAIVLQNVVIAWSHWMERKRYQREVERLDREAAEA
ncbi:MAG TPA: hypothetical protein VER03_20970 [Bryobacteraceae bacterium]|nr:hypothetical protein [Bryobacteraceae bacterium]